MRPPRKVLLVDVDTDRRSVTRFVLRTCGFRVIAHGKADAVLTYGPDTVTVESETRSWSHPARHLRMERIIEMLKQACARKRGPKPRQVQEAA